MRIFGGRFDLVKSSEHVGGKRAANVFGDEFNSEHVADMRPINIAKALELHRNE